MEWKLIKICAFTHIYPHFYYDGERAAYPESQWSTVNTPRVKMYVRHYNVCEFRASSDEGFTVYMPVLPGVPELTVLYGIYITSTLLMPLFGSLDRNRYNAFNVIRINLYVSRLRANNCLIWIKNITSFFKGINLTSIKSFFFFQFLSNTGCAETLPTNWNAKLWIPIWVS